jgi:hypothetical protein
VVQQLATESHRQGREPAILKPHRQVVPFDMSRANGIRIAGLDLAEAQFERAFSISAIFRESHPPFGIREFLVVGDDLLLTREPPI